MDSHYLKEKDREDGTGYRVNYERYEIDDGWNVPEEVIEVIEFRIARSLEHQRVILTEEKENHKGSWITQKIAERYARQVWPYLALYQGQYILEVRKLGRKLQKRYGVTELEAFNILKSEHIEEYVRKYERIKNCDAQVNKQGICDDVLAEYKVG